MSGGTGATAGNRQRSSSWGGTDSIIAIGEKKKPQNYGATATAPGGAESSRQNLLNIEEFSSQQKYKSIIMSVCSFILVTEFCERLAYCKFPACEVVSLVSRTHHTIVD